MEIVKSKTLSIILFLLIFCELFSQNNSPEITIGVVLDGLPLESEEMLPAMQTEVNQLTEGEFNVKFPPEKMLEGEWRLSRIRPALDQLQNDPEVDMVITIGSISSYEASLRGPYTKPVIATQILDVEIQKPPNLNGVSGVKNLNYVSIPRAIRNDLDIFREIAPFNKLAVLINDHFLKDFPQVETNLQTLWTALNLSGILIGVNDRVEPALEKIPDDAEAVYILPLMHLTDDQYQKLIDKLIELRLPSFTYSGAERVEQGILAGFKKEIIGRISRRVALNVQRILLGDKPQDIPTAISLDHQLVINDATARAIGVSPPWAIVTEAEMVQEKRELVRQMTLFTVVQDAIRSNLELAAQKYFVEAGRQNVNEARSQLLPSVDISGNYLIIDEDRAAASAGQQAERTLTGSVSATQVIFSEPAWANLSIQKDLQKSREYQLEQLRLDITQSAATAYLNVLRSKTYERIQQENLKLTRENLDYARVREAVGTAGPAEVYRWESEIASNRRAVIEANSQRNLAEIELNRILHQPAEESFETREIDLNDPALITSYKNIFGFIEDRHTFRVFRAFMVKEAMENSPELNALDAAIKVQERILRSANWRFFSPTLALQGNLTNVFSRDGAGSRGLSTSDLPPQFSFLAESFKPPEDLQWSIALNLSFPLFTGGEKLAVRRRAVKELSQFETDRSALKERIEQRVRSALHLAGASYASIQQARLAAKAARKSLDVVQNSYSQGMVSIVDLLDAQNAALVTDQIAANAVHNFLIDLMQVERAYGRFDFFSSEERQIEFLKRAEEYIKEKGISLE